MANLLRGWWLISLPSATFALFESEGRVTACAPYGRRQSLGRPVSHALGYWRGRGAILRALWWDG